MTKTKTDKAIAKKKLIKEKQKKVAGTAEIKTKPLHERMCKNSHYADGPEAI